MNREPFCAPPRWWAPKLNSKWVRISRRYRRRQLHRKQRLVEVVSQNTEVLQNAVAAGKGVLVTPNHSAHYDGPALYTAADRIDLPLYFMIAWQVFAMANRFECWAMQRLGCFSIDREGNDRRAFKQAVHTLQHETHPLVVFPEGDIYHTTDYVASFREGAAAIALAAARRGERPIVVVPCGIKFWYLEDPTSELQEALRQIETRLHLRSLDELPLVERIHRLAEAALALKELDYLGHTRSGLLRQRVTYLLQAVLTQLEERHQLPDCGATPPERVKALRQCVIRKLEQQQERPAANGQLVRLQSDMEDLFFVMQLYSYRGDYLVDHPSVERLAETVDKFEEDILGLEFPNVRGQRRVAVRFGQPIEIDGSQRRRAGATELTRIMQTRVQALLDELNDQSPKR